MTKKNSHVKAKLLVKISRDGSENSNGEKAVLVPAGCIQANCQVPQLQGPVRSGPSGVTSALSGVEISPKCPRGQSVPQPL